MTELEKPHLSGWCGLPAVEGRAHPVQHAACQKQIDKGRVVCECPDGHTPRKDTPQCQ